VAASDWLAGAARAQWCGHCKHLAPEYERVGEVFRAGDGVVIAKVDADSEKTLAGRFGVTGFPTLKYFPKGSPTKPEDYSGGRTAEDIVDYVNKKAGGCGAVAVAAAAVARARGRGVCDCLGVRSLCRRHCGGVDGWVLGHWSGAALLLRGGAYGAAAAAAVAGGGMNGRPPCRHRAPPQVRAVRRHGAHVLQL
jgi:protein disulfide-isomerase-like protein